MKSLGTFTSRITPVIALLILLTPISEADARTPSNTQSITEIRTTLDPVFEPSSPARATRYVGINECRVLVGNDRQYRVTYTVAAGIDLTLDDSFDGIYFYEMNASESNAVDCGESDRCTKLDREDLNIESPEVSVDIPFRALSGLSTAEDCDQEISRNLYSQIRVRPTGGLLGDWNRAETRVILDLIRPDAPVLLDSFASEFSVRVEFESSASEETRHFAIVSTQELEDGFIPGPSPDGYSLRPLEGTGDTRQATNLSLQAGQPAYIAITARDQVGNFSPISNIQTVTVSTTSGFWDFYREAGGSEEGGHGCASTGNTPFPGLLVLGLFGLFLFGAHRRRARKSALFTALLLLTTLSFLPGAFAQDRTLGIVEVKMGPYFPFVDQEFEDAGPYQEFFGDSAMLNGEIAADFHLLQGIGKLSLGAHIGYGRVRGRLRLADGEALDGTERSTFRIIPLRTSLVYRYDYSALNHGIPLVPVGKVGLDYYFWRVLSPDGDTAEADGARASGGRAGWHATLGLHLHLNFLDRRSAAAFNMNWGVKNSYLFGEYTWSRIDGFGSDGLNLSANHWAAGLAFEF